MNGCNSSETLSTCKHGNPVKFGRCLECNPMNKISFTLDDLKKLYEEVKILMNRIESLHEFKLRQCDENKENSKLIQAHEEYLNNIHKIALCDPEKVLANQKILNEKINNLEKSREAHSKNHGAIFERLEHLENLYKSSTEIESNLLNKVKELERFQDITHAQYMNKKQPYKCPVCDGKGSHKKEIEPRVLEFDICIPCQGKGIVWG